MTNPEGAGKEIRKKGWDKGGMSERQQSACTTRGQSVSMKGLTWSDRVQKAT